MKALILAFSALAGILALMSVSTARAAGEFMHEGTVVSAGGGSLVFTDLAGKQMTFKVADSVPVTINGHMAKLHALKEGMRIRVTVTKDDQLLAVNTVDDKKFATSSGICLVRLLGDALD
jgi:hypothetical protein